MKGKQYLWLKIGGNGVGSPPYAYVGGELIKIWDIDEDIFCFFDIQSAVVGNNWPVHSRLYYRNPSQESRGFVQLKSDKDAFQMLADCRGMQDIHVLVLPPSGVVDWPVLPGTLNKYLW